ncbi:MAG: hypothetical protein ACXVWV_01975 [Nocardioides sp.]
MRNPLRPVVAAALVVALSATACSGDGSDEKPSGGASGPSPATSGAAAAMPTDATIGRVTGHLAKKERAHLKQSVTHVVDGWLDAAYVSGDYPRTDFHDAFPGFTDGAKVRAHQDRRLMSNADIGRSIDAVEVTKRRLRIDVLAVRRKPVGVTARVVLDFATSGKVTKHLEVNGRLFLTRNHDGWRVFGYDVTKGGTR